MGEGVWKFGMDEFPPVIDELEDEDEEREEESPITSGSSPLMSNSAL